MVGGGITGKVYCAKADEATLGMMMANALTSDKKITEAQL